MSLATTLVTSFAISAAAAAAGAGAAIYSATKKVPTPKVPQPIIPKLENPVDINELARQKRALEASRRGRKSLIIDPALNAPSATGLSIPVYGG